MSGADRVGGGTGRQGGGASPQAQRVQSRNVKLHAKVQGEGVPFLWTHGMTYSTAADEDAGLFGWGALRDCALLMSYDARGHGASEASYDPTEYTWPSLAEDAAAVARALGADRWVAAGASMGAGVSLTAAVQHPEQILGLVLVTPPTAWEGRRSQSGMYRTLGRLARLRVLSTVFPLLLRGRGILPAYLSSADPRREERYRQEMSRLSNRVYAALYAGAAVSDLPPKEQVAAIQVPTLILAWAGDPNHPLSTAQELHRLIASSRLEIAESAEDVLRWPSLVAEFLREIARRGGARALGPAPAGVGASARAPL